MHNADHMHAWYDKIEMCICESSAEPERSMRTKTIDDEVRT